MTHFAKHARLGADLFQARSGPSQAAPLPNELPRESAVVTTSPDHADHSEVPTVRRIWRRRERKRRKEEEKGEGEEEKKEEKEEEEEERFESRRKGRRRIWEKD